MECYRCKGPLREYGNAYTWRCSRCMQANRAEILKVAREAKAVKYKAEGRLRELAKSEAILEGLGEYCGVHGEFNCACQTPI